VYIHIQVKGIYFTTIVFCCYDFIKTINLTASYAVK
jgi:hypothetical protein